MGLCPVIASNLLVACGTTRPAQIKLGSLDSNEIEFLHNLFNSTAHSNAKQNRILRREEGTHLAFHAVVSLLPPCFPLELIKYVINIIGCILELRQPESDGLVPVLLLLCIFNDSLHGFKGAP